MILTYTRYTGAGRRVTLLLAEAMAAMASDKKKAQFYRNRLEQGMKWDEKEKRWKWKDEDEPGK